MYVVEFEKNKLLVTGHPSDIYLIIDWIDVKKIENPDMASSSMTYAFLLPYFDLDTFPFIAICGDTRLSLLNVKDCIL